MADTLWPLGTSRLYSKFVRNQSCSVRAWSYGLEADAVTSVARSVTAWGKSSGSST